MGNTSSGTRPDTVSAQTVCYTNGTLLSKKQADIQRLNPTDFLTSLPPEVMLLGNFTF